MAEFGGYDVTAVSVAIVALSMAIASITSDFLAQTIETPIGFILFMFLLIALFAITPTGDLIRYVTDNMNRKSR